MHSLPFTELLGFVACQTMSKHVVIRSVEWSWSDVKTIKHGKHAINGGKSLEKRAILYTSAKLDDDQLLKNPDSSKNSNYDVFGDDDLK